jgi:hypothetical protein
MENTIGNGQIRGLDSYREGAVPPNFLGTHQVDALEQLANSNLEHVSSGWIVIAHPSMPIISHLTVRSLADRRLCRVTRHSGREIARITQNGRKAWREIEAVRARIHSAA